MKHLLQLEIETEFFDLSEINQAEALSQEIGGEIYTWKTIGRKNWLEHGAHIVDAAGLVVLPGSLPDWIGMCDDVVEEDEAEDND